MILGFLLAATGAAPQIIQAASHRHRTHRVRALTRVDQPPSRKSQL
jgi:hypothetical protein